MSLEATYLHPGRIVLAGLVCIGLTIANSVHATGEEKRQNFIFLMSGKSTAGVEASAVQEMQKSHLANFNRLAKDGKLFSAGPMVDPDKKMRGLVVVQAENQAELDQLFEPDPYVTKGYLTMEVNEIKSQVGEFIVVLGQSGIEEIRIVVFQRTDAWKASSEEKLAELKKQQTEYYTSMKGAGELGCFCQFSDEAPREGTGIFSKLEKETLDAIIAKDPMVVAGVVSAKAMPQYMAKGAFDFGKKE